MPEVTQLLNDIIAGKPQAAEELLPLVYDELRNLARAKLVHERPGHTLQATALVHEAYLRLVGHQDEARWQSRGHFFAAAAEAMRRILVDNARKKRSLRHGGDLVREPLDEGQIVAPTDEFDIVALDGALSRLEAQDQRKARLVKLRYFAGLTLAEAAAALDISQATADRDWAFARAWLFNELKK
jgi:RNA polymerase sigma factor (TIGR02999 family)